MSKESKPVQPTPAARYSEVGDIFATGIVKTVQASNGPTALAVYGGSYDRLCDVEQALSSLASAVTIRATPTTLTRLIRTVPRFQEVIQKSPYHQGSLTSETRLIGYLTATDAKQVIITQAQVLSPTEFEKLNFALPLLEVFPERKIVLTIRGEPEHFDPILNCGTVPWATQVCTKLKGGADVINYLKLYQIELDDTSDSSLERLCLFAHYAPQRLKLFCDQAKRQNLLKLSPEEVEEVISSVDSTARLRASRRGRHNRNGPRISSQRSRGQSSLAVGQGEFFF